MTNRYPDAIIIGAQRCGTTSFYNWLMAQPDIWDSGQPKREVGFFCFHHNWTRGKEWYADQFSAAPLDKLIVEKSPIYLDHPYTPARIKKLGISSKFIILLRNPIDRAYSHYWKARAKGFEGEATFRGACKKSDTDFYKEILGKRDLYRSPAYFKSTAHVRCYIRRGYYAMHLRRWLEVFPRNHFLFLKSEDVFAHPKAAIKEACDFIGADYAPPKRLRRYQRIKYPQMSAELRQELRGEYKTLNIQLAKLLGDDKWLWED